MRLTAVMLLILLLAGFADPSSETDLMNAGYDAIVHGNWWMLAGVALSGVHLAARTYGPLKEWFGGGEVGSRARDLRGFASIVALGLIGGFGHAILAERAFNAELIATVVKTTAMAVFTYVGVKKMTAKPPSA